MKETVFIILRIDRLLEIMDARQIVEVFILKEDNTQEIIKSGFVYELLTDKDFLRKYSFSNIIGISSGISKTQVLIKEV